MYDSLMLILNKVSIGFRMDILSVIDIVDAVAATKIISVLKG